MTTSGHQPVTLNKLDVARAAAKAYREGRLSAQGRTPKCKYRDPAGCPCVIGAAIDDETAKTWDGLVGSTSVSWLQEIGYILTDDQEALVDLQIAHDNWAKKVAGSELVLVSRLNEILPADEKIA